MNKVTVFSLPFPELCWCWYFSHASGWNEEKKKNDGATALIWYPLNGFGSFSFLKVLKHNRQESVSHQRPNVNFILFPGPLWPASIAFKTAPQHYDHAWWNVIPWFYKKSLSHSLVFSLFQVLWFTCWTWLTGSSLRPAPSLLLASWLAPFIGRLSPTERSLSCRYDTLFIIGLFFLRL